MSGSDGSRLEILDGGVESLDMVVLSDGASEHAVVNADRITMLTYAPRGILTEGPARSS